MLFLLVGKFLVLRKYLAHQVVVFMNQILDNGLEHSVGKVTSDNLDEELDNHMRGVVRNQEEEEEDNSDNKSFEDDNINLSIDDTTQAW